MEKPRLTTETTSGHQPAGAPPNPFKPPRMDNPIFIKRYGGETVAADIKKTSEFKGSKGEAISLATEAERSLVELFSGPESSTQGGLLGKEVMMMRASEYDDYFNHADCVFLIKTPEGKAAKFVIDVTTNNPRAGGDRSVSEIKEKNADIHSSICSGELTKLKYFPGQKFEEGLNRYVAPIVGKLVEVLRKSMEIKDSNNPGWKAREAVALSLLQSLREQAVAQIDFALSYLDGAISNYLRNHKPGQRVAFKHAALPKLVMKNDESINKLITEWSFSRKDLESAIASIPELDEALRVSGIMRSIDNHLQLLDLTKSHLTKLATRVQGDQLNSKLYAMISGVEGQSGSLENTGSYYLGLGENGPEAKRFASRIK